MRRAAISILFLLLVLLLIPELVKIRSKWKSLYRYDVHSDYRYDVSPEGGMASAIPVRIGADSFEWPDVDGKWDTVFLEIRLHSSLLGRTIEPWVEAGPKGAAVRQYLERGVDGVRLVNISPIARDSPEKGKKVNLRGSHLAWDPQEGKILLFRNGDPTRHRILVIAPHPDDAEIAAFGLYSHRDSYIVTLTAGESGDNEYTVFYPVPERDAAYVMKGRLRVLDSITVPLIGGISPSRAVNLGYFDNTLREMYRSPDREQEPRDFSPRESNVFRRYNLKDPGEEVSRKPTWNNMVEDLAKILRHVRPDIIVAPHPLLEEHPDHQYAYIALADALGQIDIEEGRLFLYTNHLVWSKYFPFGPLDGMVSLPPGFGEVPLKGVYSHPVSPALRVEKRFALDAMHDLRSPPPSDTFEFRDLAADFRDRTYEYLKSALGVDTGYFRRALRPNELFFVYPYRDSEPLKNGFLLKTQGESQKR